ncbi:MAG: AraC family transcriptional regulator [Alistipes sp.]|nr:AraC family transcriptional regulator [Alistipes sp.]
MVRHFAGSAKIKVDMVEYDLSEPINLIRVMSGQILMVEHISDDFDGVVVIMSNSFVESMLVYMNNALPFNVATRSNCVKHLNNSEVDLSDMFLKAIAQVLRNQTNPHLDRVLQHVMMAIFYSSEEIRNQLETESGAYTSADAISKEFMRLVKDNFRSERQLQFYADKLCITPRYLSRVVKECTGSSAADWIERYVVLEARALLKSTSMTIQQISDELNFPSQTFFGKYFKRRVGMSPKLYRRQG